MAWVIAVYEIDRHFGGHEEGGWWYDAGHLCRIVASTQNEDKAYAIAERINRLLAHLQKGKRPVSSIAYCGGRHAAQIYKNYAPTHYPEIRPHYE
jgi:hypothetical protein